MTYLEFCILLTLYIVLVIANLIFPVKDARNEQLQWLVNLKNPYRVTATILVISVLFLHLIGLVGLFLLWPIGVYLFFGTVTTRAILDYSFFGELKKRGGRAILAYGTLAIELAIVFIALIGPASGLFDV